MLTSSEACLVYLPARGKGASERRLREAPSCALSLSLAAFAAFVYGALRNITEGGD